MDTFQGFPRFRRDRDDGEGAGRSGVLANLLLDDQRCGAQAADRLACVQRSPLTRRCGDTVPPLLAASAAFLEFFGITSRLPDDPAFSLLPGKVN